VDILKKENKVLLRELVITDFKLRYQGSILGYLWSILKPMMLFAIMFIVFMKFLKFGDNVPHFAVAMLLGTVIWNFFSEVVNMGMVSIFNQGGLLRKVAFPKYILILSILINASINFCINFCVVIVFGLLVKTEISVLVLLTPLLFIELAMLSLGVAMILATIYVKYRDISPIWDVFLQGAFYGTPIIYPIYMIFHDKNLPMVAKAMMLNPMAQIIQDLRFLLTDHSSGKTLTSWNIVSGCWLGLIPITIVFVVFLSGIYIFNKNSCKFAEMV
jgi:ABC-2 type transport system permease protein